jgi:Secretion system C-terminal sorting domain
MKKKLIYYPFTFLCFLLIGPYQSNAQCYYIAGSTTVFDSLSYTYIGGGIASFGCAPIDPTYWMSQNGMSVTVNFVNPQNNPTFRVWGMNDDDVASVMVNGNSYPLNAASASYDAKVVCGLSPGPDGIIFSGGNIVGANSNVAGNFSYQNVQLIANNINSITVSGIAGAGWGFAGVSIHCPLQTASVYEVNQPEIVSVYPNPGNGDFTLKSSTTNGRFTVNDVTGRIVLSDVFLHNQINFKLAYAGIYYLNVITEGKRISKKLVVSK